ncbi:hypothetical protein IWQ55_000304 [Labrenzia sp. EL_208]|nr:hypothetical protein [Labrenzia sp. EL_132]MBG6227112.1 hypothetical protein [Labrenzia sp. EL_208]
MARNRTLLDLLVQFRDEAGLSGNVAHNKGAHDKQVRLLQRVQRRLWEDTNWDHLHVYRDVEIEAGQRYFAPPEDISADRITRIEYRYINDWCKLDEQITSAEYNTYDSDSDERAEPISNFDVRENDQIEVWPIPETGYDASSNNGLLRVWGYRDLRKFVDDDDRCDLDGDLIVIHAALEELADKENPKSNLLADKLRRLENSLFSHGSKIKQFKLSSGSERPKGRWPRHPVQGPAYRR